MAAAMRQHLSSSHAAASTSQHPLLPLNSRVTHLHAPAIRHQQQQRGRSAQPPQALNSNTHRQPLTAALQQKQHQQQRQQLAQQQQQWQRPQHRKLLVVYAAAEDSAAGGSSEGELDPNIPAVDQDFDLLGAEVKRLQALLCDELKGCSIYLIGMMGSGKSTTGKMLANTLKYAFFDTDSVIERAHPNETVADIFSKYGEDYFRQCETQVLKELAPYKSLVVSTGGGAVTRPKNWSYMHNGIVAWLQGQPDLLARRVAKEGVEKRPLLFGDGVSDAEAYDISLIKLTRLLEERTKFYENADVVIDLRGYGKDEDAGAPTAVVMYRLMDAIYKKIQATKEEREAKRQFTIERAGDVPTMRTQPSPAAQAQQEMPAEE